MILRGSISTLYGLKNFPLSHESLLCSIHITNNGFRYRLQIWSHNIYGLACLASDVSLNWFLFSLWSNINSILHPSQIVGNTFLCSCFFLRDLTDCFIFRAINILFFHRFRRSISGSNHLRFCYGFHLAVSFHFQTNHMDLFLSVNPRFVNGYDWNSLLLWIFWKHFTRIVKLFFFPCCSAMMILAISLIWFFLSYETVS